MTERLSERERIRAILLNKTPLEAADWHLAEVARIVEPLVMFKKNNITSVNEYDYMLNFSGDRIVELIDETLKLLGGGI